MEYVFSQEANVAIKLATNSSENLFITGKAGTGKSTLLAHIRRLIDAVVVAPTGIAAINVDGQTIHSFFKLKPGYEYDEAANIKISKHNREKFKALTNLIIDEISMVRADLLDAIDILLRRSRGIDAPFGGVRVIFVGDLFQLPPVVSKQDHFRYESPYFFAARLFEQQDLFTPGLQLKLIELKEVYRQKDYDFIQVLNRVRENRVRASDLEFLNSRVGAQRDRDDQSIRIMTTNMKVNTFNSRMLDTIDSQVIEYRATSSGRIENIRPNDQLIQLKIGAQVMFINNDSQKRWVNGSLGRVTRFVSQFDEELNEEVDLLEVQLADGSLVTTAPFTWEISEYIFRSGRFERHTIGTFTQIPLKLAWAVTVHKSQGKTFDRVVLDLGAGSFSHGQTYVALSRCTSLDGLTLSRPVRQQDIKVDRVIVDYFNRYST